LLQSLNLLFAHHIKAHVILPKREKKKVVLPAWLTMAITEKGLTRWVSVSSPISHMLYRLLHSLVYNFLFVPQSVTSNIYVCSTFEPETLIFTIALIHLNARIMLRCI